MLGNRSPAVVLGVVLLLQVFVSTAWSQDQTEDARKNSLEPGSWAIQFQITDEFGLKPFDGTIISLKRHVSRKSAFRLGLGLGWSFDDSNIDQTSTRDDSLSFGSSDVRSDNQQSIQVDLLYMNYPNAGAFVNVFWGAGPLVRYARTESEIQRAASSPNDEITRQEERYSRSWRTGLLAALGVEWFVAKKISFHGEYRAELTYGSATSKASIVDSDGNATSNTSTSEGWDFNGGGVILGISLYF